MKISNTISTLLLGTAVLFSGCGQDDEAVMSETTYSYSVKVTNLTSGQPLSPVLVSSTSLYSVGQPASVGLEKLAEGGDNSELLDANGASGTGLVVSGASETMSLSVKSQELNIVTMLVKTNDAFAGVEALDVSTLAVGETKTVYMNVYDAGTEANTETNTTVASFGVEGFNVNRDDINIVTVHAGIISKDDGLITSALTALEKFNNPAAVVRVTRTK